MFTYIRSVVRECKTALCSFRFLGTTLAFLALMLLDAVPTLFGSGFLQDGKWNFLMGVVDLNLITTNGATYLFWLRFCLYAVPCGCCFYEEYSNHAAKYRLVRGNVASYGLSKMTACVTVTSLSVIVSELLYGLILLGAGVELVFSGDANANIGFYGLLAEGKTVSFWLLLVGFKCFAAVFFSAMTLALSGFIRNRYLLISMPLATFFCLDSFTGLWFQNGATQPDWINWRILFFSLFDGGIRTEKDAFLRTAAYTGCAVCVFTVVFLSRIRKVVEHE